MKKANYQLFASNDNYYEEYDDLNGDSIICVGLLVVHHMNPSLVLVYCSYVTLGVTDFCDTTIMTPLCPRMPSCVYTDSRLRHMVPSVHGVIEESGST